MFGAAATKNIYAAEIDCEDPANLDRVFLELENLTCSEGDGVNYTATTTNCKGSGINGGDYTATLTGPFGQTIGSATGAFGYVGSLILGDENTKTVNLSFTPTVQGGAIITANMSAQFLPPAGNAITITDTTNCTYEESVQCDSSTIGNCGVAGGCPTPSQRCCVEGNPENCNGGPQPPVCVEDPTCLDETACSPPNQSDPACDQFCEGNAKGFCDDSGQCTCQEISCETDLDCMTKCPTVLGGICQGDGTCTCLGSRRPDAGRGKDLSPLSDEQITRLLQIIYRALYPIALGVGFIIIVKAAYTLMTSQGSPDKVTKGKDELTSAIMGVLFVLLAAGILRMIVSSILGGPID